MKRAFVVAVVLMGCLLALQGVSFAHGGQYRGPSDTVPPQLGGPGDSTPPPVPGGPATPGAGPTPFGPNTPGAGPNTPGAAPGPISGPMTGKRNAAAGGPGFEQWSFWWENNKDRFLNLRQKVQSGGVVTGDTGYHLGRGKKNEVKTSLRPTDAQIKEQVIPALQRALTDDDFDTRAAGYIGLGKCGTDSSVIEDIKKGLTDSNSSVRESAALGLGILGQPDAIPALIELMNDSQEARRLLKSSSVENRTRAFASIGLGLINDKQAIPDLLKIVENAGSYSNNDVPIAAIQALGLIGDPSAVPMLTKVLENAKLNDFIVSAVPIALGKIGDQSVVPMLEKFIKNEKVNDLVRWSAIIGYSRLLKGSENEDAIKLLTILMKDGNPQTRNFATMGVAYIGGDKARTTLLSAYRGARAEQMPWISMSLAVFSWNKDRDDTIVESVRRAFQEQKNPSFRSGHAVALGLLKDRAYWETMTRELAQSRDVDFQGYLCVALGLMEATESMDHLKNVLKTSRSFPKLQQQAAIGLGLMGDKDVVALLADTMEKTDSAFVLGSSAIALGLIGDRNAIEPMVKIAGNPDVKKIGRALATVGLGIVGDKDKLPRLSRVAEDNNYRAKVDFMAELLTIL
ncbi:MAG: HEAT repeat domain-containing protein [Planctomycetota bacterium]